jgi:hypothetical protein
VASPAARAWLCTLLAACGGPLPPEIEGSTPLTQGHGGADASAAAAAASIDAGAPQQDAGSGLELDAYAPQQDTGAPLDMDAELADARSYPAFDSGASSSRSSLVLPELWMRLDAGADPFTDRLAMVDCRPDAVVAETLSGERVLGVETAFCNYLTAHQPAQRAVAAGEVLKVRLWHFELSADEPAEAHAVLQVDGLSVLDERIPIPSPGGLVVRQLRVERAIAKGAPLYFHLHNHGANSWALVEVSAGPG